MTATSRSTLDLLHDAVAVLGRLDVERDDVRAGLSEGLDLRLGMLDHQVDIEDALRCLAQALDDRRAQRDVRHVRAVHDIDVDVIGAGVRDTLDLIGQVSKIGGKDGRCNLDHLYSFFLASICASLTSCRICS